MVVLLKKIYKEIQEWAKAASGATNGGWNRTNNNPG